MIGASVRLAKEIGDPKIILKLYDVYMRPIQEYACVFWNSEIKKQNEKIESLHRKITSMAIRNPPYWMLCYTDYEQRIITLQTATPKNRYMLLLTKFIIKILKGDTTTNKKKTIIETHLNTDSTTRNPNLFHNYSYLNQRSAIRNGMEAINCNRTYVNLNSNTTAILNQLRMNIIGDSPQNH